MTNEEMNTALYMKMFAEQEEFEQYLLTLSPKEILEHSYEYTIREDIILALEYNDMTNEQCKVLMGLPSPLKTVYERYQNQETDYMETIFDTIERCADEILLTKSSNKENPNE